MQPKNCSQCAYWRLYNTDSDIGECLYLKRTSSELETFHDRIPLAAWTLMIKGIYEGCRVGLRTVDIKARNCT